VARGSLIPTLAKFKNQPTTVDGIRFASKAEARRYQELCLLCKAGKVKSLTRQTRWPLTIKGELICTYVSDFEYFDNEKETWVVEDVKGFATPLFQIKAKLMRALYRITIVEIHAKNKGR